MNKCEICGRELKAVYAAEWRFCEECRKEKAELEKHQYESSKQNPIVNRYLQICLVSLLACVAIALTQIPYFSDAYADNYFVFIRTWVLIINYAIQTPFLCLHYHLYCKQSKGLVMSLIAHVVIIVLSFPTSAFFWSYI